MMNSPSASPTSEDWKNHPSNDSSRIQRPPLSRGPSTHLIQTRPNDGLDEKHPFYYGRVWKARTFLLEYAGEFFGTMVLVMFGTAANCQYNLSANSDIAPAPAGTWGSLSLGWGTGIALGILLSGGHINPAVTLAMTVWRRFPWQKVPGYIICQLLGGIIGAAIVYGNYKTAISIQEGGNDIRTLKTAAYFGTVPQNYMTNMGCFFDEFIGTALLLFGILSILDKRNQLTPGLVSVGVFIVFIGISACFGMQTGFALNPARDLGPRILTSMVGYGSQVFTLRHQYWLWSPILASILGAQTGTMLYDVFLHSGMGDESFVSFIRRRATLPGGGLCKKDNRV